MSTLRTDNLQTTDSAESVAVADLAVSVEASTRLIDNTLSSNGVSVIGFKNVGTGAVSRNYGDRAREYTSTGDYATLTQAMTEHPNGVISDPLGINYKNSHNLDLSVFTETTDPLWKGTQVYRTRSNTTHPGSARIATAVEMRPFGSGQNGPSNSDYGTSISVIKQDWFNTTQVGEIDGQNITVRQGGRLTGGVLSDCAGTLYNVGIVHGSGWAACVESQTSTFNQATAAVQMQVQTAMGVLDSTNDNYFGFTATANAGALNAAFFANNSATGHWNNYLQFLGDGNVEVFKVDESGRIVLRAGSGATPSKTIRALNGALSVLDHAQTTQIFTLSDTGSVVIPGSIASSVAVASGAAFSAGAGTVVYGGTLANSANAGPNGALPATVAGYIICNINNTQVKIPYYAN